MSNARTRRLKRREQSRRPSMLSYLATVAAEHEAEERRLQEEDARRRREHNLQLKNRRLIHMRALVAALGGDIEAVVYDDQTGSALYAEGDIELSLNNYSVAERIDFDNQYAYPYQTRFSVSAKNLDTYYYPKLPRFKLNGDDVEILYPKAFALEVFKAIALVLNALANPPQEEPTA